MWSDVGVGYSDRDSQNINRRGERDTHTQGLRIGLHGRHLGDVKLHQHTDTHTQGERNEETQRERDRERDRGKD